MHKKLMRVLGNSRGQFAADVGNIVALLVIIAVGALVLYSITDALDVTADSHADNAISNVEEQAATVFNLLTILAIVVVAAVIIGVVMRAIGGVGGAAGAPAPIRMLR